MRKRIAIEKRKWLPTIERPMTASKTEAHHHTREAMHPTTTNPQVRKWTSPRDMTDMADILERASPPETLLGKQKGLQNPTKHTGQNITTNINLREGLQSYDLEEEIIPPWNTMVEGITMT
ncbi:unnamed protein product [Arabis nemorensis]|uniref:Uncharacterized protein n=1 Tax=Arabis nemorensis TaxID=586526 RepID=A0A565BLL6_9BRAS|nr:unnamed protein product [Arabis nemorensis]